MINDITDIKILELRSVNAYTDPTAKRQSFLGDGHYLTSYFLFTTEELYNNPKFQKIIQLIKKVKSLWDAVDFSDEEVNRKISKIPNNTIIKWLKELQDEYIVTLLSIDLYSTNFSEEEKKKLVECNFDVEKQDDSRLSQKFFGELFGAKEAVRRQKLFSDLFDFSFDGEDGAFLQEVLKEEGKIIEWINENIKDVYNPVEDSLTIKYKDREEIEGYF